jgi:hypothetical protein
VGYVNGLRATNAGADADAHDDCGFDGLMADHEAEQTTHRFRVRIGSLLGLSICG